jgi:hypothetical protein
MSGGATPVTGERAELVGSGRGLPLRRGRRRRVIVAVVLVLIAAGAAVFVRGVFVAGEVRCGFGENGSA